MLTIEDHERTKRRPQVLGVQSSVMKSRCLYNYLCEGAYFCTLISLNHLLATC